MTKHTDWIQTYTGKKFYPLEPDATQIDIEDIAHALSNMCRFTGHCREFYSVAQHSVHVAENCPKNLRLCGLLHDAAEAYLSDVTSPIKPFLLCYGVFEEALLKTIMDRFKCEYPVPEEVKIIDRRMCYTEGFALMPDMTCWEPNVSPYTMKIVPMWPKMAEAFFLNAYDEFSRQK